MDKKENNMINDDHKLHYGGHRKDAERNDFFSVKELVSFLGNYEVPPIDPSSIIDKTFKKIELEKKRRRRHWIISVVSIAASIIVLFVLYCPRFLQQTLQHTTSRSSFAQMRASDVDIDAYKEVTLLLSGHQIALSGQEAVRYDKFGNLRINGKLVEKGSQNERNQLIVPAGKRTSIVLADGTKMNVNSRSYIVYPMTFQGDKREIYAEGEAFLDVAHNKQKPFIVKSADFNLQVLGTRFNIRTYKQLKETQIVLVNGSVEVTDHYNKKALMLPNQLVCLNEKGISRQATVDVSDYVSWINGWLNLDGETLDDIVRKLSVYYGKSIICDPSVSDKKLYGKLELKDNIDDVLLCIRQIIPIGLHKDGSVVRINNPKSNSKTN